MVPVCVEISRWTWRSEHRGRNGPDGQHRLFAGVTDPLWISPGGRDIGVDSLTTQLVINRCLTHRADTLGAGLRGAAAPWCGQAVERVRNCVYRLWTDANDGETDASDRPTLGAHAPERGPRNHFCISL